MKGFDEKRYIWPYDIIRNQTTAFSIVSRALEWIVVEHSNFDPIDSIRVRLVTKISAKYLQLNLKLLHLKS